MDILDTIKKRQSVRDFSEEKISEEHLKIILDAAYHAPIGRAAYNRYELIVIKHKEKIDALAQKITEAGILTKHPFFHAPLVIFVAVKPNRERLDGCDTGCLIENMMLAATSLGLGSCFLYTVSEVINGRPFLLQALGLSDEYRAMSAVVIGHPKEKDLPPKVRPGIATRVL
ncbi:MAG TPA: nitroreductase family protein [Bacilli bacterium]|nr:nitroreductase family protein [Bacilli bacterium]HPK67295.1 nitroreductase family protein [Bacilli bacterium]